jgi:predicted acylesterase/phospholipase RssA
MFFIYANIETLHIPFVNHFMVIIRLIISYLAFFSLSLPLMLRLIFNYYVVLKSCWIILVFQLIGFVGLVVLEQGKDILQSLSFSGSDAVLWHTWFVLLAVLWWSWQSWRSSRVILHFTSFDFIHFGSKYALQAQVLIPRLLGVIPILIFTYGLVQVSGWGNPLVYVYLSFALWLYIFFHLRREMIILFLSRNKIKWLNIPDYVPIKNDSYPAKFIWAKQGKWIWFRFFVLTIVFSLVVIFPVRFPQWLGASAIILFALGSWLVIATLLDYAEKRFRFPFTFTIVTMIIGFSFFNNNHEIRTITKVEDTRLGLEEHFGNWYSHKIETNGDTIPVILVAGQGGGVRSAYWMSQVLSELTEAYPQFEEHTYAYSAVSGGSLGVATYKGLARNQVSDLKEASHKVLSKDFLSPVSSWLVVPDLVQKFLPFPVHSVDRAKALEYSWERAAAPFGSQILESGFLETYQNDDCVYIFNSTRVENGFRTLVTNVKPNLDVHALSEDFFDITHQDIPISTAISVSSRFPFITPPALVYDKNGKKWGHLVDGGYVENMGATAMLELYDQLHQISTNNGYKVKFHLLFIKNTKEEYSTTLNGMHELVGPLNTFSKVWVNSGYYDENSTKLNNLYNNDAASFINLDRSDETIIPLGWYLSEKATSHMQNQVATQTAAFKLHLQDFFGEL